MRRQASALRIPVVFKDAVNGITCMLSVCTVKKGLIPGEPVDADSARISISSWKFCPLWKTPSVSDR